MKNKNKSSTIFTPGVLAVFLMIFSGFFATTMHCLIRFATEDHHPFEVAFFRTIFVLVIFFPFVAKKGLVSLKSGSNMNTILGSLALFSYGSIRLLTNAQNIYNSIQVSVSLGI